MAVKDLKWHECIPVSSSGTSEEKQSNHSDRLKETWNNMELPQWVRMSNRRPLRTNTVSCIEIPGITWLTTTARIGPPGIIQSHQSEQQWDTWDITKPPNEKAQLQLDYKQLSEWSTMWYLWPHKATSVNSSWVPQVTMTPQWVPVKHLAQHEATPENSCKTPRTIPSNIS